MLCIAAKVTRFDPLRRHVKYRDVMNLGLRHEPGCSYLRYRGAAVVAQCCIVLALAGCQSVKRDLPQAALTLPLVPRDTHYAVQPGDVLQSRYVIDPALDQQALVTPDGRVSFRFARDILAAGETMPQLRNQVIEQAQIRDPGFDVVVQSSIGTRVYVIGEVVTPGEIDATGNISALQAVSRAGGFKITGQIGEVVLLRRELNNHATLYAMDLEAATDGRAPEDDVMLQTSDIIYVPRSRGGNVSLLFERIRNAIPFNFSLFYGNGDVGFLK